MALKGSIRVLPACVAVLFVIALSAPVAAINALATTSIRWVKPDPNHPPHIECQNIPIELEVEVLGTDIPVQYVKFSRWDGVQQEIVVIGVDDAPPYQSEIDSQSLDAGWSQPFAEAFDELGDGLGRSWTWIYKGDCTYFLPLANNFNASAPDPNATPLLIATTVPSESPNETPTKNPTQHSLRLLYPIRLSRPVYLPPQGGNLTKDKSASTLRRKSAASCHPERSEGSEATIGEILHYVQNDDPGVYFGPLTIGYHISNGKRWS